MPGWGGVRARVWAVRMPLPGAAAPSPVGRLEPEARGVLSPVCKFSRSRHCEGCPWHHLAWQEATLQENGSFVPLGAPSGVSRWISKSRLCAESVSRPNVETVASLHPLILLPADLLGFLQGPRGVDGPPRHPSEAAWGALPAWPGSGGHPGAEPSRPGQAGLSGRVLVTGWVCCPVYPLGPPDCWPCPLGPRTTCSPARETVDGAPRLLLSGFSGSALQPPAGWARS